MKLTFITLFLSTTGMFASVNSQNTRVNIHILYGKNYLQYWTLAVRFTSIVYYLIVIYLHKFTISKCGIRQILPWT